MQMGSWEGNEICKYTHPHTHTHTHTHTHMSTSCVAERDLGFAFFGAKSLPGRSPFSSPTATLPAISKFFYASIARTHENTIAHQSRPRAKVRLRMDVGATLARPAMVLDTRYGTVRIPHQRLPGWDRLESQLVNHSWAGINFLNIPAGMGINLVSSLTPRSVPIYISGFQP
jgi:hypothetical protein